MKGTQLPGTPFGFPLKFSSRICALHRFPILPGTGDMPYSPFSVVKKKSTSFSGN
jgi:hypothetical protein